jgi:hypothetical protein
MADRIKTYEEFWPFYLREHSKPMTRAFHFVGTHVGVLLWIAAMGLRDWRLVLAGLVSAYGMAWVSHFFIEKNRPATFTYPGWSFVSDFRMLGMMWTGRLGGELARHVTAS